MIHQDLPHCGGRNRHEVRPVLHLESRRRSQLQPCLVHQSRRLHRLTGYPTAHEGPGHGPQFGVKPVVKGASGSDLPLAQIAQEGGGDLGREHPKILEKWIAGLAPQFRGSRWRATRNVPDASETPVMEMNQMLNLNTWKRHASRLALGAFLLATPAFGQVCTCPGDMNHDGLIDGADLGALLGQWGSNEPTCDLNHDNIIDGADLGALLGQWGPCGTPINDWCTNALNIEDGQHPYCTLHATEGGPNWPSGCQSGITYMYKDIWFKYKAETTGPLTLTTCGATDYDSVIAVYGSAVPGSVACPTSGSPTMIACNDDDFTHCSNAESMVTVQVTAGYHYLIRLGGFAGGGTGTLTVSMGYPGVSCINAIPVPISQGSSTLYVSGSTSDNPTDYSYPQTCFGVPGGPSEWIRYVPTCNGTVIASTCMDGTDYDTIVTVLHGNPGDSCWSNFVTCNDDTFLPECFINGLDRKSRVQFPVIAGHTYYIVVSGYHGMHGNYEMSLARTCN